MDKNLIAKASISINAPNAKVWDALVNPDVSGEGAQTRVHLSQDKNPTEQAREHSEKNWDVMLTGLKKLLEQ
jgi:hypothetical protein